MKTTMDGAGRLVVPREIRRLSGWRPGIPLEVSWRDGRVEIEPAPTPVRLEQRGALLVAVPCTDHTPPLTLDQVEQTLEDVRHQRESLD
jgi:AbrB family looped-hinge helix DNA binding protein